ncbi:hypothetical protein LWI29_004601 [Acer saccharum]|uniref:Uncharacterized protein n=1 Tax=Acer saccharum TaxID=4024 RepID=A0AA39RIK9_ACESA|nr:hypothetical protein LWI29_004601 [Acer saccharum]
MRHVLAINEQLIFCFEDFDRDDKLVIKFKLVLAANDMEFPVDLLGWREHDNAENVSMPTVNEPVKDVANMEHPDDEPVEDAANDESDGSEVDNNYEVDDKSEDDSNEYTPVTLDDLPIGEDVPNELESIDAVEESNE